MAGTNRSNGAVEDHRPTTEQKAEAFDAIAAVLARVPQLKGGRQAREWWVEMMHHMIAAVQGAGRVDAVWALLELGGAIADLHQGHDSLLTHQPAVRKGQPRQEAARLTAKSAGAALVDVLRTSGTPLEQALALVARRAPGGLDMKGLRTFRRELRRDKLRRRYSPQALDVYDNVIRVCAGRDNAEQRELGLYLLDSLAARW